MIYVWKRIFQEAQRNTGGCSNQCLQAGLSWPTSPREHIQYNVVTWIQRLVRGHFQKKVPQLQCFFLLKSIQQRESPSMSRASQPGKWRGCSGKVSIVHAAKGSTWIRGRWFSTKKWHTQRAWDVDIHREKRNIAKELENPTKRQLQTKKGHVELDLNIHLVAHSTISSALMHCKRVDGVICHLHENERPTLFPWKAHPTHTEPD